MTQNLRSESPSIFIENLEHELAALTKQITEFPNGWHGIYISIPGLSYSDWKKESAQILIKNLFTRTFQILQKYFVFFFCDNTVLVLMRMPSQLHLDNFTKQLAILISPKEADNQNLQFKSLLFDFSISEDREKFISFSKTQIEKNKKLLDSFSKQEEQFDFNLELDDTHFIRREKRSETIALIIEDDEITSTLLRGVIDADCYVLSAESAKKAKLVYEANMPDLVFLDIGLPDTDGLTILEKIKAKDKDVDIVMLTANGYLENVKRALSLGAQGFIVKPFTAEKVKAFVKNARS